MNEYLNKLLNEPTVSQVIDIATPLIIIVTLFTLTKITPIARVFRVMTKLFLYEESNPNTSKSSSVRLSELESQVESMKRILLPKTIESHKEAIEAELQKQLSQHLPELIDRKIRETNAIENSLNAEIKGVIGEAVSSYLTQYPPSKLLENQREQIRIKDREMRGAILENTIQEQMGSAGRLKTVMINLFVLFNTGVLLIYFFAGASLTDKAVTAIIGLYISLAAFIVYIYRTSNFRSSVLLALHEDGKKYYDAEDYLRRLKPGASPTDRDVEVLKLLLLNRSEREKMADHPYELILKGVTNSNIQLKGGKMISSAKGEK